MEHDAKAAGLLHNLQALRAIAALSIVFFHIFLIWQVTIPFGNFGVDLFFVLSGYLMTRIASTDQANFFARRLIRIVPLYWICTLVTFSIGLMAPHWLHSTAVHWVYLAKSLFFVPYVRETGLMAPILNVGWTLNYEMYFYTIYAISLRINKSKAPWITLLLILIPTILYPLLRPSSLIIYFYSYPIVLEFVFGIIIYKLLALNPSWSITSMKVAVITGLVGLALMEYIFGTNYRAFALGIPAAIVVLSAVYLEGHGYQITSPVVILIGNASYALYLSHFFILRFCDRLMHFHQITVLFERIVCIVLLVMICFIASGILHLYLELPIQRYLKKRLLHKRFSPVSEKQIQSCCGDGSEQQGSKNTSEYQRHHADIC